MFVVAAKCTFAVAAYVCSSSNVYIVETTSPLATKRRGSCAAVKINFPVMKLPPIFAVTNTYCCKICMPKVVSAAAKFADLKLWCYRQYMQLQLCFKFCSCKTEFVIKFPFITKKLPPVSADAKVKLLLQNALCSWKLVFAAASTPFATIASAKQPLSMIGWAGADTSHTLQLIRQSNQ